MHPASNGVVRDDIKNKKSRILIYDDDRAILELLRHKLSMAGFEPRAAVDEAGFAKEVFSEPPDLVILDICLGGGRSGTEIYDHLLKAGYAHQLPIIFVSAFFERNELPSEGAKTPYPILRKPFDFDLLLATIRTMLAKRS